MLLQEFYLRHADPQKPKLSMTDRLVSGLTPGCFLSSSSSFTFPIPGPATFTEEGEMLEFKTIKTLKLTGEKLTRQQDLGLQKGRQSLIARNEGAWKKFSCPEYQERKAFFAF